MPDADLRRTRIPRRVSCERIGRRRLVIGIRGLRAPEAEEHAHVLSLARRPRCAPHTHAGHRKVVVVEEIDGGEVAGSSVNGVTDESCWKACPALEAPNRKGRSCRILKVIVQVGKQVLHVGEGAVDAVACELRAAGHGMRVLRGSC